LPIASKVKVFETFVLENIWKGWEVLKSFLAWKEPSLRIGLYFNDHSLWWSSLILFEGKSLVETSWFLAMKLFGRGIESTNDLFDSSSRGWISWLYLKQKSMWSNIDRIIVNHIKGLILDYL
jgi:hypothetical protein